MKYKLLALPLALLLSQSALAATKIPQPKACPTVAAIQAGGIDFVNKDNMIGWTGFTLNKHYETPEEWGFIIAGIEAQNENDAMIKANEGIALLSLSLGPESNESQKEWTCMYQGTQENSHLLGMAITPVHFENLSSFVAQYRR